MIQTKSPVKLEASPVGQGLGQAASTRSLAGKTQKDNQSQLMASSVKNISSQFINLADSKGKTAGGSTSFDEILNNTNFSNL
jgi:hypothetical protein